MDLKRIVIIGGGYGGIEAAKKLSKSLKKRKNTEITLIDRNPFHTLMTELHEVAGNRVSPDSVRISFNRIFAGNDMVNFSLDSVEKIDFENNTLKGKFRQYSYDYLVLATGGDPNYFGIPGIEKYSFPLWSYNDALKLKEQVDSSFLKAAREPDKIKREKILTFAIAGGGFTGVELAGELVERKKTLCRKYGIQSDEVSIILIEGLCSLCTYLSDKGQTKTREILEKMGVKLYLNYFITSVDNNVITLNKETKLEAGTLIWTAGVKGSSFSEDLGIGDSDKDRRPASNSFMQSVKHENVYIVGDNLFFKEGKTPLPKIVETALQTAETASHNITADIMGGVKKEFKSNYHGFMVSIGSRYAVAQLNSLYLAGLPAMAVKHLVNFHYLFGLAGLNALWGYLKHEFLDIKDRRSMIGEIAAYKIPNYWTVPLRLLLGGKWLYEGVKKIFEGWLVPGAGGFLNPDPSSIRLPGVDFSHLISSAADTVSAASEEAVEEVVEAVSSASEDVVEQVAETVAAASDSAYNAAADAVSAASDAVSGAAEHVTHYVKPLIEALPPYTWFAENVLSQSTLLAFFLQASVIGAEIAVGLALLGGCFTFLAAGVSLLLSIMFISSGWGNPELLWYMAAAIVMIGGGGRGFGLDHWVIPFTKRWWNRRKIAHKTYLYLDEPEIRKPGRG